MKLPLPLTIQVDPEETDMWAGLKKVGSKILNFSGNNDEYRQQYGKPILW